MSWNLFNTITTWTSEVLIYYHLNFCIVFRGGLSILDFEVKYMIKCICIKVIILMEGWQMFEYLSCLTSVKILYYIFLIGLVGFVNRQELKCSLFWSKIHDWTQLNQFSTNNEWVTKISILDHCKHYLKSIVLNFLKWFNRFCL